jgi:hypothetical protein
MTMATAKEEEVSRRAAASPQRADDGQQRTYEIGASVSCEEGPCGELTRLVVDPLSRAVTHLVVEPHGQHGLARLVPVTMVEAEGGRIRLRCTLATYRAMQYAEETEFLEMDPVWQSPGYPGEWTLVWPYYAQSQTPVRHECIPLGEVEIRRGEHVQAEDGAVGKVQGLIVDAADQRVSHVLLQEGHLWGAKQVAIPIGAVSGIDAEGIHVALSKHAIGDLPEVDVKPPLPAGE